MRAHHLGGVVVVQPGDAVARRHGAADGTRLQLQQVLDHLLLGAVDGAGLRAGLGQCQDVVGRDALVAPQRQACGAHQRVGAARVQPHQRPRSASRTA
ncbi:MAG: hypothetical protein U1E79_14935 [Ottowia sp.]